MKRIILVLACLLSYFLSEAQAPKINQYLAPRGVRVIVRDQLAIDSALLIPRDTIKLFPADTGAIARKGNTLYMWSRVSGVYLWNTVSTSSSGVTNFSFNNANGFTGVVSNPGTTPSLTLTLQTAGPGQSGQLAAADWNLFNGKLSNITGLISAGTNITITGSGTSGSPYVISGNAAGVTNVSGTTNRITVTNPTTTPVVDISNSYAGQTSITTLGTVSTGTWNGSTIGVTFGGTGSNAVLNNNRVMQSSGGAIIEAAAITPNRALISNANGIPTHSTVTNTELGFVSGVTSAIQTQLNTKLSNITGLVTAGTDISITGSGTSGSPYVINSTAAGGGSQNTVLYQSLIAYEGTGSDPDTLAVNPRDYGNITVTGRQGDTWTINNGAVTNAMLVNSTISGIALGGVLNSLTILPPLTGSSYNGSSAVNITLGGLTALGTANQIPGMNAAATGFEYKTLVAGSNVTITHGTNTITIAATGGGGGGITTVGTFSGSGQTNGATISGSTITFGPATASIPGMVSTGAQTWAGDKTFNGDIVAANGVQTDPTIHFADAGSGFFRPDPDVLGFSTAGSERMRIGSSGNVGIGTQSASRQLEVRKNIAANYNTQIGVSEGLVDGYPGISLIGNGGKIYSILMGNSGETAFGLANNFAIFDGTSGVVRLRIASNGETRITNLSGTGTRAVLADVDGDLLTQLDADWAIATAANTANYTNPATVNYVILSDLTGQANRTYTLPASPRTGQRLVVDNRNTSGSTFNWTFAGGTVKDAANTTITTVAVTTVYQLVFDGTNWKIQN